MPPEVPELYTINRLTPGDAIPEEEMFLTNLQEFLSREAKKKSVGELKAYIQDQLASAESQKYSFAIAYCKRALEALEKSGEKYF